MLHQTGSGVLGPVFRAFDSRHDRIVAIKAFRLDILPEQVVRFANELRELAARQVSEASIVPVVDAGLEDTTPYLVMLHQGGETLDVAIRRMAPATLEQALPLLRTLAETIDTAWSRGVGHGALHPRDIFLGTDRRASGVTGFGVVRALEAAGIAGPVRRPYSAPERGQSGWTAAADIYSLGAVAHEVLTKRRPAGAGEQDGVFAAGLAPAERVNVRRALTTALAERPDARFQSANEFILALEGAGSRKAVAVAAGASTSNERAQDWAVEASSLPLFAAPEPEVSALSAFASEESVAVQPAIAPAAAVVAEIPVEPPPVVSERLASTDIEPVETLPDPASVTLVRTDGPRSPVEMAESWLGQVEQDRSRAGWSWVPVVVAAAMVVGAIVAAFSYQLVRDALRRDAAPVADALPATPPAEIADAETAAPSAPIESIPLPAPTEATDQQAAPDPNVAELPARQEPSRPVPAASPESSRAGRLIIRSDPSGAMVTIDGRLLGDTPLTLRDLRLGTHALQIARPGHVPRVERVTLSAAVPERTLDLALAPALDTAAIPRRDVRREGLTPPAASAPGAVDVASAPRGARVSLDGRFVGLAPLRVPEVTAGTHVLSVEMAGYQSVSQSVAVLPGRVVRLTPVLVKQ